MLSKQSVPIWNAFIWKSQALSCSGDFFGEEEDAVFQ
jgi:hypothetical protein